MPYGSDNNRRPIRPATARLTVRMLSLLLDSGVVTACRFTKNIFVV